MWPTSFGLTSEKIPRVERALIALGQEELRKLMDEQERTEVTCEYCRSIYHFTRKDLESLTLQS